MANRRELAGDLMVQHGWLPAQIWDMDLADFVFAIEQTDRVNRKWSEIIDKLSGG